MKDKDKKSRDRWILLVTHLYTEFGEGRAVDFLGKVENESRPYPLSYITLNEGDFWGWVNGLLVPSDGCGFYLVCNALGDRYLARYDCERRAFYDDVGYEGVVAYLPVWGEEERRALGKCCGRKNCLQCACLRKENGLPWCRNERCCGGYRYGDWMPRYRVPMWRGREDPP